jgi:hypothetical protein
LIAVSWLQGGEQGVSEQNRVTPWGEIVATPLRGGWTGNRGILHDGHRIVRSHASDLWITCALSFQGRWSEQWRPHHFTWLYFHDEAVSLAAGHRPCAECRRGDYLSYREAWAEALTTAAPTAKQMNQQLHGERIVRGTHTRRLHAMPWRGLPDGVFVRMADELAVVVGEHLTQWTLAGYGTRLARPRTGEAAVVTPPSSVAALLAGYPVQLDGAAR